MDGIAITNNDEMEVVQLEGSLAREFEIKDLNSLKYFLGIEIAKSRQWLFICQKEICFRLVKGLGNDGV